MSKNFPMYEGALEGYRFVIKMPVQFRDIDAMNHVNNVAYFAFLETTRLEYIFQLIGIDTRDDGFSNVPFLLVAQSINYRTPAYFRETLLIGMRTSWVRRSSFGFDYEMRAEEDGRLVAQGEGTHVMYNAETQRSYPMPDEWVARLEQFEGRKLKSEG